MWRRVAIGKPGYFAEAWCPSEYQAGLGYDRKAAEAYSFGTPGYANDAIVRQSPVESLQQLAETPTFSEIMFTSRGGLHSLPQWIEIYNPSHTETVDLEGWHLEVEARHAERHRHDVITFQPLAILPNQTVLLVSSWGRNSSGFTDDRVYNLYDSHGKAFGQRQQRNRILSAEGFSLKLTDPTGLVMDQVGNLDGVARTDDQPTWTLPRGETDTGTRTSILRRYQDGEALDGTAQTSWHRAAEVPLAAHTYYGWRTDIGTPGVTDQLEQIPTRQLSFSELMFATRSELHSSPQWIELYNPSYTEVVNLEGWHLEAEVYHDGEHHYGEISFEPLYVLPNQTVLLVTGHGRNSKHFPENRIYNLLTHHNPVLDQNRHRNSMLSADGFYLKLSDPTGMVVDVIGNLDGDSRTKDDPRWTWPSGKTEEGTRSSLIRRYENRVPLDGTLAASWQRAAEVQLTVSTYWGHQTDIGTPGYRRGGPLPVTLSHFRAERTEAGNVAIKWVTESALDNAGFNLLRSQTKRGPFRIVNPVLIQGAGTTSERRAYTWTDKTTKPNAVYYYQLEEVSHAGDKQTLATVRLRGHVSPAGKVATQWGALKTDMRNLFSE